MNKVISEPIIFDKEKTPPRTTRFLYENICLMYVPPTIIENPQPRPYRKRLMKRVLIVGMVDVAQERIIITVVIKMLRLNITNGTV